VKLGSRVEAIESRIEHSAQTILAIDGEDITDRRRLGIVGTGPVAVNRPVFRSSRFKPSP
jgi:hypothetical protein